MNTITFKTRQINNYTPISNIFIEKYIPKANATYVIIYIYLYRFFYTNTQTSIKSVSSNLSILESDIINAIKYWESVGLMTLEENIKDKSYVISFTNILDSCLIPNKVTTKETSVGTSNKVLIKEHKYTPEEIGHILKYNGDIKQLIGFIESKYAATFTTKNLNQVLSLFDSLDLSLEVYQFLVTYAHGKGIGNINSMLAYVEKIAVSLCEKKITSLEEAEKYLSKSTNYASTESKPTTQQPNKNKFMNFDEPEWDFDEIKRSEQEYLENDLKRINNN